MAAGASPSYRPLDPAAPQLLGTGPDVDEPIEIRRPLISRGNRVHLVACQTPEIVIVVDRVDRRVPRVAAPATPDQGEPGIAVSDAEKLLVQEIGGLAAKRNEFALWPIRADAPADGPWTIGILCHTSECVAI